MVCEHAFGVFYSAEGKKDVRWGNEMGRFYAYIGISLFCFVCKTKSRVFCFVCKTKWVFLGRNRLFIIFATEQ